MKTTDNNKQKKQHRELSDEELKNVTGGGFELKCPDGRKVSSMEECFDLGSLEAKKMLC